MVLGSNSFVVINHPGRDMHDYYETICVWDSESSMSLMIWLIRPIRWYLTPCLMGVTCLWMMLLVIVLQVVNWEDFSVVKNVN